MVVDGNEDVIVLQWSEQFGSAGEEIGRGIAVGPQGQVVFSGYSYGDLFGPNEGESDLVLARVCPQ